MGEQVPLRTSHNPGGVHYARRGEGSWLSGTVAFQSSDYLDLEWWPQTLTLVELCGRSWIVDTLDFHPIGPYF